MHRRVGAGWSPRYEAAWTAIQATCPPGRDSLPPHLVQCCPLLLILALRWRVGRPSRWLRWPPLAFRAIAAGAVILGIGATGRRGWLAARHQLQSCISSREPGRSGPHQEHRRLVVQMWRSCCPVQSFVLGVSPVQSRWCTTARKWSVRTFGVFRKHLLMGQNLQWSLLLSRLLGQRQIFPPPSVPDWKTQPGWPNQQRIGNNQCRFQTCGRIYQRTCRRW